MNHKEMIKEMFERTQQMMEKEFEKNKKLSNSFKKAIRRKFIILKNLWLSGRMTGVEQCKECPLFIPKKGDGTIGKCTAVKNRPKPCISGDCLWFWKTKLLQIFEGTGIKVR